MEAAMNRDIFLEKLNALIASKRQDNCFYFSKEKYSKILSEVVSAKAKCSTPLDYRRLKRFDVLKIKDVERLIAPLKPGETNIQFYVTNEELFNILHETHTRTNHGGRTRMLKELQVNYKNITYDVVGLYLSLCKQCLVKRTAPRRSIIPKPVVTSESNSRCRVDLIDMQANSDGDYKFVMVYEDYLTKFVQLRPLRTNTAEEVAHHVLQIFLTFGAPDIFQSDNGNEFNNQVLSIICTVWKNVGIVQGSPTQGSGEKTNQDIKNMLASWMAYNNTNNWAVGLLFVQFAKNTTYHEGICKSPYEAMFGIKPKKGLASSFLPSEQIVNIKIEEHYEDYSNTSETEEQVEQFNSTIKTEEQLEDSPPTIKTEPPFDEYNDTPETEEPAQEGYNAFQNNVNSGHIENYIPRKNIEQSLQYAMPPHQAVTNKHGGRTKKRGAPKQSLQAKQPRSYKRHKNKRSTDSRHSPDFGISLLYPQISLKLSP